MANKLPRGIHFPRDDSDNLENLAETKAFTMRLLLRLAKECTYMPNCIHAVCDLSFAMCPLLS